MIKKVLRYNRNKKGAALALVLIVFSVVMILLTSIVYLTRQDIRETVNLEERLQTYYVAAAGVDLTYAALMDPTYNPKKIEAAISKLGSISSNKLTDTISVKYNGVIRGTAKVTINRVTIDEKKWLQIVSIGKLEGKNTEVTTTMRINEENPNQIVRQKFGE